MFYCLTKNILVFNRYGFRSEYTTTDCLVDLVEEIIKALVEEKCYYLSAISQLARKLFIKALYQFYFMYSTEQRKIEQRECQIR